MIITIGGIKGGIGKSTIAAHFAVFLAQKGQKVLLLDTDAQATSSKVADFRKKQYPDLPQYNVKKTSGKAIIADIEQGKGTFDHIVIDVPATDTLHQRLALQMSDIWLIPMLPTVFEIWTLPQLNIILDKTLEQNPAIKGFIVLNQVDSRNIQENEMVRKGILAKKHKKLQLLTHEIGARKAFKNANNSSRTVEELEIKNKKAIEEIKNVFNLVLKYNVL